MLSPFAPPCTGPLKRGHSTDDGEQFKRHYNKGQEDKNQIKILIHIILFKLTSNRLIDTQINDNLLRVP